VGYPVWDHSLIADGPGSTRTAVQKGNLQKKGQRVILYIPFVREEEKKTKAILRVVIDGADTAFRMLYPQQYRDYGFKKTKDTEWDAQNLFNAFADFDYDLFGITQYIVKDGRIFGKKKEKLLIVTRQTAENNKSGLASRMASVTLCNTWTSCVYASENPDEGGSCTTTTNCTTYWYDDGTGSGSDTGDSGGGSSGGSGGSGDDGDNWPDDPCASDPVLVSRLEPTDPTDPATPCGDEPWEDADDKDYPCPGSFNFVRTTGTNPQEPTWQSAVVTDYHMILASQATGGRGEFRLNIGTIEIGMPYRTFEGDLIHPQNAKEMASIAGGLAELAVMNIMAINIRNNPALTPGNINYQYYKTMFKEAYKSALDDLLRRKYYDDKAVSPSTVVYNNFTVTDPSQYRRYDYSQDGCL
jgi:hypothetical protein